jgi:hypothetical protein
VVSTRSRTARLRLHGPRFRGRDQTAIRRCCGGARVPTGAPAAISTPSVAAELRCGARRPLGVLADRLRVLRAILEGEPEQKRTDQAFALANEVYELEAKGEFEVESGVRRESRSRATHEPRPCVELLVRADFDETFAHGPQRCLRARGEAKLAQDVRDVGARGWLAVCSWAAIALLLSPAPSRRRISSSRVVRAASDQSPDPARRDDVRLGARVWRVLWEK